MVHGPAPAMPASAWRAVTPCASCSTRSARVLHGSGARGFFSTPGAAVVSARRHDRRHELLRHQRAQGHTLERLVDFDRINAGATRFSVGAVNVRTGNFVYFDTDTHTIGPEHVMASGALPPGFPAIEIEGEHYWDGGLVSNTPLQWVVESRAAPRHSGFPGRPVERARRAPAQHLRGRDAGEGDPLFEPHPRRHRPVQAYQKLRRALAGLLDKMPEELKNSPEARAAAHRR